MEKKERTKESMMIFWIFIIGSILGYLFEMTIVLFQKGRFESRQGLIYGPFTPVYGMGVVVYYLILKNIKIREKWKVFIITAILGGITEYIFSFLQEKLFGTISWDYSYLRFNLNGRTSLLHCTYWGIAGVLYITFLEPLLEKLKEKIDQKSLKIVTVTLAIFMVFNISISYVAADRQTERRNHIEPKNKMDQLLDKYYPDEYMDNIYANKKEIE